jgi:hypothetical protein
MKIEEAGEGDLVHIEENPGDTYADEQVVYRWSRKFQDYIRDPWLERCIKGEVRDSTEKEER